MNSRTSGVLPLLFVIIAACDSPADSSAGTAVVDPPRAPPSSTGTLLVKTRTGGVHVDADGYRVLVHHGTGYQAYETGIGANDSVSISLNLLGAGGWYIRLRGVAANCWVVLPNSRHISVPANQVSRVDYAVDCTHPDSAVVYDRITGHASGTIAYHGNLSESYVLRNDGRFRLRYNSSRFGEFEYVGTVTRPAAGRLDFGWEDDGRWAASGVLRGDTLSITYNTMMWLSDFEPGAFVRRFP